MPRDKIDTNWRNEDFDWAISVWAKVFVLLIYTQSDTNSHRVFTADQVRTIGHPVC